MAWALATANLTPLSLIYIVKIITARAVESDRRWRTHIKIGPSVNFRRGRHNNLTAIPLPWALIIYIQIDPIPLNTTVTTVKFRLDIATFMQQFLIF